MTNHFHKIKLSTVDSTNNFAAKLINEGLGENNMVIMADFQTEGKGQFGNNWYSEHAKNMTFSIIKGFDKLSVDDKSKLIWAVSISISNFLKKKGINAKVKWPNDIMVENSKIAGVLIENRIRGTKIDWSIIGIGLNVNQIEFHKENITSMRKVTKKSYRISSLISDFLDEFNEQVYLDTETLLTKYIDNLYLKGIPSKFTDISGEFEGIITGVDQKGQLLVKKQNGISCKYDLKEISFQNDL